MTPQQAYQLALDHHQSGRLAEAEGLYRQILAQQPDHADAMQMLGMLAHQVGRRDPAIDLIRRAIQIRPGAPEYHVNLGIVLAATAHLDEALAAFRQALALRPDYADGYYNLGNAVKQHGRLDEAVAAYRRALALRPGDVESLHNLGEALQSQGQIEEAIAAYRQAIALRPNAPESHNNLGNALLEQGDPDGAIASYRRALDLRPQYAEALYNLGNAFKESGRLDEAIDSYRRAISAQPAHADAYNNLGIALKDAGRLDEALDCFARSEAIKPAPRVAGNRLYALYFHPGFDSRRIYQEHARWAQTYAQSIASSIRPHRNAPEADRRLRIGYVSPDFTYHPVGRFIEPLLAHHDRDRHEIVCYADVRRPDAMTARLQGHVDVWRNAVGLSDERLAQQIADDGIDLLVDLTMHMARSRLLVFARRPAPVQVTYLAYCGTTGLSAIDYRLTDPYLDPPGINELAYAERSVRLPRTYWCYAPFEQTPAVGPLPAAERGYITFGCLNNFAKASGAALETWCRLLCAVPNSRLILHAHEGSHRQRVREQFAAQGIGPDRLEFVGLLPMVEYFRQYERIDIGLDPFPYPGGTTTCDALWMGVPVVSLAGQTALSRSGLSILSNVGLPELVAQSAERYVQVAIELASADLSRLFGLRASLRQRMLDSPLMDAPRFARDIESAYRQMWRTWCRAATAG